MHNANNARKSRKSRFGLPCPASSLQIPAVMTRNARLTEYMSVSGVDDTDDAANANGADGESGVRRQGKTMQPRNLFGHLPLWRAPLTAPRAYSASSLSLLSAPNSPHPKHPRQDAQDPPFHDQNFTTLLEKLWAKTFSTLIPLTSPHLVTGNNTTIRPHLSPVPGLFHQQETLAEFVLGNARITIKTEASGLLKLPS